MRRIRFLTSTPSENPCIGVSARSRYVFELNALPFSSTSIRVKSRITHRNDGKKLANSAPAAD